jgi:hypothetical protein
MGVGPVVVASGMPIDTRGESVNLSEFERNRERGTSGRQICDAIRGVRKSTEMRFERTPETVKHSPGTAGPEHAAGLPTPEQPPIFSSQTSETVQHSPVTAGPKHAAGLPTPRQPLILSSETPETVQHSPGAAEPKYAAGLPTPKEPSSFPSSEPVPHSASPRRQPAPRIAPETLPPAGFSLTQRRPPQTASTFTPYVPSPPPWALDPDVKPEKPEARIPPESLPPAGVLSSEEQAGAKPRRAARQKSSFHQPSPFEKSLEKRSLTAAPKTNKAGARRTGKVVAGPSKRYMRGTESSLAKSVAAPEDRVSLTQDEKPVWLEQWREKRRELQQYSRQKLAPAGKKHAAILALLKANPVSDPGFAERTYAEGCVSAYWLPLEDDVEPFEKRGGDSIRAELPPPSPPLPSPLTPAPLASKASKASQAPSQAPLASLAQAVASVARKGFARVPIVIAAHDAVVVCDEAKTITSPVSPGRNPEGDSGLSQIGNDAFSAGSNDALTEDSRLPGDSLTIEDFPVVQQDFMPQDFSTSSNGEILETIQEETHEKMIEKSGCDSTRAELAPQSPPPPPPLAPLASLAQAVALVARERRPIVIAARDEIVTRDEAETITSPVSPGRNSEGDSGISDIGDDAALSMGSNDALSEEDSWSPGDGPTSKVFPVAQQDFSQLGNGRNLEEVHAEIHEETYEEVFAETHSKEPDTRRPVYQRSASFPAGVSSRGGVTAGSAPVVLLKSPMSLTLPRRSTPPTILSPVPKANDMGEKAAPQPTAAKTVIAQLAPEVRIPRWIPNGRGGWERNVDGKTKGEEAKPVELTSNRAEGSRVTSMLVRQLDSRPVVNRAKPVQTIARQVPGRFGVGMAGMINFWEGR